MTVLKYSLLIVLLVVCISAVNTLSAPEMAKQTSPDMAKAHEDTAGWEIPLTAGIYYPHKGTAPEAKMRYYRVRCWPGCHVGSDKGMYPNYPLVDDKPIFPTSTINNMRDSHGALQD
jgi:hypothetical protein